VKEDETVSKPAVIEYTIHNYDAVNRAIESTLLVTESKASWFSEVVKELKSKKILLLTISACIIAVSAGFLLWLFMSGENSQRSDTLSGEERDQLFDQSLLRPGQEFILFEEVGHELGEDVITAFLYRYPETETPADQWCYLAVGGEEISRHAHDRGGVYDQTARADLIPFTSACRFKVSE
jgi:hypothetical protein